MREGAVQGREVRDHAVNAGDREDAEDRSTANHQQQLAACGPDALVRGHQGVEPGLLRTPVGEDEKICATSSNGVPSA
jgi:hypothetical protein